MKKGMVAIVFLLGISVAGNGQTGKKDNTQKTPKAKQVSNAPRFSFDPKKYVYFPDFYAFYDPQRGYVFWNAETKTWKTSQEPPKFMIKNDQSNVRIQILEGLHLDLRPEQNYPNYMKLYPARENDPKVPVPNSNAIRPR